MRCKHGLVRFRVLDGVVLGLVILERDVGGAAEPVLCKGFEELDVRDEFILDDDTHAFLEHELAVVDGPEADVHLDVLEIHRDVLHEGFLQCLNEALVREDHAVGEEHTLAKKTPRRKRPWLRRRRSTSSRSSGRGTFPRPDARRRLSES